jgi:hypothetical protein
MCGTHRLHAGIAPGYVVGPEIASQKILSPTTGGDSSREQDPRSKTMRAIAAVLALSVISAPALAATPKVEAAIKAFQAVGADANRLKTFCALMKIDEKMGDKKDPLLEAQFDKLLDELGADFKAGWDVVEDIDERTPDGKALNDALDRLEDKCRG